SSVQADSAGAAIFSSAPKPASAQAVAVEPVVEIQSSTVKMTASVQADSAGAAIFSSAPKPASAQAVAVEPVVEIQSSTVKMTSSVQADSAGAAIFSSAPKPAFAQAVAVEPVVEIQSSTVKMTSSVQADSAGAASLSSPAVGRTTSVENQQQAAQNIKQSDVETPMPLTTVLSGSDSEKVVTQTPNQTNLNGEKIVATGSRASEINLKIDESQSQMQLDVNKAIKETRVGTVEQPSLAVRSASSELVAAQEGLRVSQAQPADEKIKLEAKADIDPTVVATGAAKETVVIKEPGKLSSAQVNALAADVIQQVTSQMKVRIKSGNTTMHLQLNPRDLGTIDVQMIKNTQGVSVTFFAEQAATGQLLETQINQLRQSLKDAGVNLTGLNISQYDQPKQEGGFLKQGPHFSQYSQRGAQQAESVIVERERPQRIGGSSSEIDYLI
ncbi:MAG: flagellar hook-length control protein FliK, partial [Chloroflexi bacterium]|nr:flagellar hook-length control protein FliK [Chloroflexota bacterium]